MIKLGLTGSIGMGKSTVAAMFRDEGVPVFDADVEVHRLYAPGGALVAQVEAAFPGTTGATGVDRRALGRVVLGDASALARLEALIHPAVGLAREQFLTERAGDKLVLFDIPLLYEKGPADALDGVAVVSAPPDVQRARVLVRPGMDAARLDRILAFQLPDVEKRTRADFVIDTGVPLADTRAQVAALVACLAAHGVRYCRACARSSSTPRPPG